MKLNEMPLSVRPREKLVKYGIEKLLDEELIALIIGTGNKQHNVSQLSRKILDTLKDNISELTVEVLTAIPGVGISKASQIISSIELTKRLLMNKESKIILSAKDIWVQLEDIRKSKKEHFIVFFLDVRNQEIKKEIISIGTLDASLVHPREVFEPAIKYLTSHIILAHNHPSGNLEPSDNDIAITKKLVAAGQILGIEVIDHVIVVKDGWLSFREKAIIQ